MGVIKEKPDSCSLFEVHKCIHKFRMWSRRQAPWFYSSWAARAKVLMWFMRHSLDPLFFSGLFLWTIKGNPCGLWCRLQTPMQFLGKEFWLCRVSTISCYYLLFDLPSSCYLATIFESASGTGCVSCDRQLQKDCIVLPSSSSNSALPQTLLDGVTFS